MATIAASRAPMMCVSEVGRQFGERLDLGRIDTSAAQLAHRLCGVFKRDAEMLQSFCRLK
jgi:hypothetical protein